MRSIRWIKVKLQETEGRAESREGFMGRAASPLPTSYGVWGSAVSSARGVHGEPRKMGILDALKN